MNKRTFSSLALGLLLLTPAYAQTPKSGLDLDNMDPAVSPCTDFYLYANGGWMKKNPIPADKPRWGTFNALADRNQESLNGILKDLAATPQTPGSLEQKLADFYASGIDVAAVNAAGLKPLQPELDRLAAVKDLAGLQEEIAHLHTLGFTGSSFFEFGSVQDARDSSKVIAGLMQGGLGLPEREYYFRTDEKTVGQRAAYVKHIAKTLELAGAPAAEAAKQADMILALETRLAKASLTNVQMRDPEATYHPMDLKALAALTPHFDWPTYLQRVGAPPVASINVGMPDFFKELDAVWSSVPLADQLTYLRWQLLRRTAGYLPEVFGDESFNFYGKTLQGTPAQLPRWRRVVTGIDSQALGEGLGKKYVEKYFPPTSKARVMEMINNLKAALKADIQTIGWMGPETKKQALEKLSTFRAKIGYPDKWKDYSTLTIGKSYLDNLFAVRTFGMKRDLAKIGKPVDPNDWYMSPPTVNAYYDPQTNEIVFPAGILQPPFFTADADDAVNYGALGMVIGHEMTHGFDDSGAQYDARGNLKNWWTKEDLENFKKLSAGVEKQYSSYKIADDLFINGKLVLGESIADLGGLKIAYLAYQKYLEGKQRLTLDGFTPEQRFFLGYARVWAMNMRPEYERLQVNTDPHPHPKYRVNGPLGNMPEFVNAFKCPLNSPMIRPEAERNQIW